MEFEGNKDFVLGIIPARGGSKGIKDKNIRPVAGKPLIAHTIEAALAAKSLDDVIVSTDSPIIAEVAAEFGAKVPFLRPKELAGDSSPMIEAVRHAMHTYEKQMSEKQTPVTVGIIVLLQPPTPLRLAEDIDEAVAVFLRHPGARSLITCCPVDNQHPMHMYHRSGDSVTPIMNMTPGQPRQEFDPVYICNGAVFVSSREMVLESNAVYEKVPLAYEMPRERSVDVDSPLDLELVEFFLARRAGA